MFGGQKGGRPDACDEHVAALVLFSDHSFRAFPVLFHIPSMRTPSLTQETAHFETMLPFFAHEYRLRRYCLVFCISAKGSTGPLIESSFNPTSTQEP